MRRRTFITGSLLAGGAAAAALWRARLPRWPGAAPGRDDAEPLPDGRVLVREVALAFGTTVSAAVVDGDPEAARAAARSALDAARRVDRLMTVYRPDSEIGRLNATGVLDAPHPDVVRVLEFSQRLAALTRGAFDVTVQPLWDLYAGARQAGRLPSPGDVARARSLVDWTALEVSPRRVRLGRPGMGVTLNGVAQGYAADLALAALRARGIQDALLDTGEHAAAGARQPGRPWTLGIQHPRRPDEVVAAVAMDGRFLATSGDYATPFSDDFLHHHVFDPATGDSPRRLSTVVVAAATGMEADALTKPVMILEQAAAERLLAAFPGAGAAWIDKDARLVAARGLTLVG